jgi:hypothetical protein
MAGWHPLELSLPARALFLMNELSGFLNRLLGGLIKLVLVIAASVFVVSFLLAALVVVLVVSLWSLITGRKPAPLVMFGRMREQSQRYSQGMQGMWPNQGRQQPMGDVVDVQATEVVEEAEPASRPEKR